MVANLSSDMLLCPADPLTKGGLLLSRQQGARWGNRSLRRDLLKGPEPPTVRAERLLLSEHVVLSDLSQPGDGSGTVAG